MKKKRMSSDEKISPSVVRPIKARVTKNETVKEILPLSMTLVPKQDLRISSLESMIFDLLYLVVLPLPMDLVINLCQSSKILQKRLCNNPQFWEKKWKREYPRKVRMFIHKYEEAKRGNHPLMRNNNKISSATFEIPYNLKLFEENPLEVLFLLDKSDNITSFLERLLYKKHYVLFNKILGLNLFLFNGSLIELAVLNNDVDMLKTFIPDPYNAYFNPPGYHIQFEPNKRMVKKNNIL
jgi:hypothetical protein